MIELLETRVLGNPAGLYLIAALLAGGIYAALVLLKRLLLRRFPPPPLNDELDWRGVTHNLAKRMLWPIMLIVAVVLTARLLYLPAPMVRGLESVLTIALFIQAALWADQIIAALLFWRLSKKKGATAAARSAMSLIHFLVRVAVWSIAFLLILDNLNFDVTALVAGLGIGGIAIALAAQSILGDLFASLSIVLDRPIEVGDFIVFGEQKGTVERIGIKTTRLRALSGEQIIVANTDLLSARIHNYKRMSERRITFVLSVAYETTNEALQRIPVIIREIIAAQDKARFDRAHLSSLAVSSLDFEIVYWVLSPEMNDYMDVQQAINLGIIQRFREHDIEFPFPTFTINMDGPVELAGAAIVNTKGNGSDTRRRSASA